MQDYIRLKKMYFYYYVHYSLNYFCHLFFWRWKSNTENIDSQYRISFNCLNVPKTILYYFDHNQPYLFVISLAKLSQVCELWTLVPIFVCDKCAHREVPELQTKLSHGRNLKFWNTAKKNSHWVSLIWTKSGPMITSGYYHHNSHAQKYII